MTISKLEYDATKIDKEKYPPNEDGSLNPVTSTLVYMTLYVDLGHPKWQPEEWVRRVQIYEKVFGPHMLRETEDGEWVPEALTTEEIQDHVELVTNVNNSAKAAFNKKVLDWLKEKKVAA